MQSKTHKSRKTAEDQAQAGKPRRSPLGGSPPTDLATTQPTASLSKEGENTAIPEENAKKQWWYRKPGESKDRKTAAKVAVLQVAGHKDEAIGKRLGMKATSVRNLRYIARKNGWWDAEDEPIDLEEELALGVDRKIVRNINASLDGQMTNWQTHEMTVQAAKGAGYSVTTTWRKAPTPTCRSLLFKSSCQH